MGPCHYRPTSLTVAGQVRSPDTGPDVPTVFVVFLLFEEPPRSNQDPCTLLVISQVQEACDLLGSTRVPLTPRKRACPPHGACWSPGVRRSRPSSRGTLGTCAGWAERPAADPHGCCRPLGGLWS